MTESIIQNVFESKLGDLFQKFSVLFLTVALVPLQVNLNSEFAVDLSDTQKAQSTSEHFCSFIPQQWRILHVNFLSIIFLNGLVRRMGTRGKRLLKVVFLKLFRIPLSVLFLGWEWEGAFTVEGME